MTDGRKTWGSVVNFDATFGHLATLEPGEIVADPLDMLTEQERRQYHEGLKDVADKQVWPLVYSALGKTIGQNS